MTVGEYHRELVERIGAVLGERVVGVYASGSFALGDFDPARSDLDVQAVFRGSVSTDEKHAIVAELRHETLPCPARGLEFVLYPEESVRVPSREAGFALNLNTGARLAFRLDETPVASDPFWFPLDRAVLRAAGIALAGPPPQELFAPIPRSTLLPVVRESLEWHLAAGHSNDADAVLNTCRSLRWLREDVWSSKGEAGEWALHRVDDRELVAEALALRGRGAELDRRRVQRFVRRALDELLTNTS